MYGISVLQYIGQVQTGRNTSQVVKLKLHL